MKKYKTEGGSITSFTLLSIMFFVIVLVGIYVGINNKIIKQRDEIEKIKESYQQQEIDAAYNQAYKENYNSEGLKIEVYNLGDNNTLIQTIKSSNQNLMKDLYVDSEKIKLVISSNNENDKFVYSLDNMDNKKELDGKEISIDIKKYPKDTTIYVWKKNLNGNYGDYYTAINFKVKFSNEYGKIDVIWLDTNNNVQSNPNKPQLGNMVAIKWDNSQEISTTSNDIEWYNYKGKNTDGDNNESKWANAKNVDGSYFVWIPRFAYRITYYSDSNHERVTGYSDGNGIRDLYGNVISKLDKGIESIEYGNKSYIVHPAFVNELNNGGWDSNLSGFWMAKYEMTGEISNDSGVNWKWAPKSILGNTTTQTNEKRIVSKPGVQTWASINIGNCYINSFNYDREKESHLIKNSEWGAVAYLTYSQYGRNGNEVNINNSEHYTAGSLGATALTNVKQSTTGNEYGIYDMNGGSWEYTSVWNSSGDTVSILQNGAIFLENKDSTKYATKYENNTTQYQGKKVLEVCKFGDGIKETWNSKTNRLFEIEFADFVGKNLQFFRRGGTRDNKEGSGIFSSGVCDGKEYSIHGFRTVLVINN